MKYKETILKVIAECCRLLIGVVFIFSGFVKAVDPMGFAIKIGDYLKAFSMEMFQPFALFASINLCAIEFVLGITILLGVYRRYSSILVLIFMLVMTPLTLYLALFDPVSDCGCFGDAVVITNWETFFKNIILLAAAIFVFIHNQRLFQVYTFKVYWFVAFFAYIYCGGFSYYNYSHLPLLDFRPYKIGANIPDLMTIPEGAPQDEYKYSFIYEKDGVKKEFTLENYPANDSTWKYVDSKTELIKQGYTPPIAGFNIYNQEDIDVTDEILSNQEGVLLLISAKLEDASENRIDDINNIFDYAQENNIPFYCVTGSSSEEINNWIENTGAEYPFLLADEVLLKTIIRSNPGLVLLKGGTVLMKWHYNDIPEEEKIGEVIESYREGKHLNDKRNNWITTNLFTFTLPLLLVWIYDYIHFRRRRKEEEESTPSTAKETIKKNR